MARPTNADQPIVFAAGRWWDEGKNARHIGRSRRTVALAGRSWRVRSMALMARAYAYNMRGRLAKCLPKARFAWMSRAADLCVGGDLRTVRPCCARGCRAWCGTGALRYSDIPRVVARGSAVRAARRCGRPSRRDQPAGRKCDTTPPARRACSCASRVIYARSASGWSATAVCHGPRCTCAGFGKRRVRRHALRSVHSFARVRLESRQCAFPPWHPA